MICQKFVIIDINVPLCGDLLNDQARYFATRLVFPAL